MCARERELGRRSLIRMNELIKMSCKNVYEYKVNQKWQKMRRERRKMKFLKMKF